MTDHNEIHMTPEALEEMVGHPMRRSSDIKGLQDLPITVGRLEQSIENTSMALRDFAARTNSNIDRLTKSLEDLNRNQLMGKQTNWGMIASWVGVLVLLLGLVVYQPLQEIRSSIYDHKADGHPASVITRIENNESKFGEVMDQLQREITLLEKADQNREIKMSARIEKLESMALEHVETSPAAHAVFVEQIAELKEAVKKINNMAHDEIKAAISLKERVLNVEREIYTGSMYRSGRPIKTPADPQMK